MDEDNDKPNAHHDIAWWLLWAAIAVLGIVGLSSFFRAATSEPVQEAAAGGATMVSTAHIAEG